MFQTKPRNLNMCNLKKVAVVFRTGAFTLHYENASQGLVAFDDQNSRDRIRGKLIELFEDEGFEVYTPSQLSPQMEMPL